MCLSFQGCWWCMKRGRLTRFSLSVSCCDSPDPRRVFLAVVAWGLGRMRCTSVGGRPVVTLSYGRGCLNGLRLRVFAVREPAVDLGFDRGVGSLATHETQGDGVGCLSAPAKALFGAVTRQEWQTVGTLQKEHPEARAELIAWGLISDEPRPVPRDPQKALREKVSRELAEARRLIDLVATLPDLSRELIRDYQHVHLRASGASVYLAEKAEVNARLQDVVADAKREILAAQPDGPRSRDLLEIAVSRDTAALDRGVELRTIYRDTVRDHAVTAEYARTMSARTSGRPAQYRTLPGDFERMIIVDREQAFVSNHVVAGAPPHAAWLVTDPAVVAVLASMFDAKWRHAQPWYGELRTRGSKAAIDVVSGADGVRTNRQQRSIMRYLCDGESQEATARKLDMSRRKLQDEIAGIKALWGVTSLAALVFQYAQSPDRLVNDSDTAAADGRTCPGKDASPV